MVYGVFLVGYYDTDPAGNTVRQRFPKGLYGFDIQVGSGLIQKQDLPSVVEGAGQADLPLLPAG